MSGQAASPTARTDSLSPWAPPGGARRQENPCTCPGPEAEGPGEPRCGEASGRRAPLPPPGATSLAESLLPFCGSTHAPQMVAGCLPLLRPQGQGLMGRGVHGAGLGQANQSSQCGRAGWEGALGVGVSQRPQAGETLGRKLLEPPPDRKPGDAGTQASTPQVLPWGPKGWPGTVSSGFPFCGVVAALPTRAASTAPDTASQGRLDSSSSAAPPVFKCHLPPIPSTARPAGVHHTGECVPGKLSPYGLP